MSTINAVIINTEILRIFYSSAILNRKNDGEQTKKAHTGIMGKLVAYCESNSKSEEAKEEKISTFKG